MIRSLVCISIAAAATAGCFAYQDLGATACDTGTPAAQGGHFVASLAVAAAAAPSPSDALPSSVPVIAAEATPEDGRLVVHEWGTFTSFVAPDGAIQAWRAGPDPDPLPPFVESKWQESNGGKSNDVQGTVRMETPVLYFYSDEHRVASATVAFPLGRITEWYPWGDGPRERRAAAPGAIAWRDFEILAGPSPQLPVEGESHYYAARATDANAVRYQTAEGPQVEKFLFYRGIGTFDHPLVARTREHRVFVTPHEVDEVASVIVVHRVEDRVGFRVVGTVAQDVSVPVPLPDRSQPELERALFDALVTQGLYGREAEAMIDTWRDLWFQPGLRVLYVVPQPTTATLLPLELQPQPDELVRVLVGRLDLLS